jgi:hypothetical protein
MSSSCLRLLPSALFRISFGAFFGLFLLPRLGFSTNPLFRFATYALARLSARAFHGLTTRPLFGFTTGILVRVSLCEVIGLLAQTHGVRTRERYLRCRRRDWTGVFGDLRLELSRHLQRQLSKLDICRITRQSIPQELEPLCQAARLEVREGITKRLGLDALLRLLALRHDRFDLLDASLQGLIVRSHLRELQQGTMGARQVAALQQIERHLLELRRIGHSGGCTAQPTCNTSVLR